MEQWLPIAIIALALVVQSISPVWVEVVVTYLALYVPWKMMKIEKLLRTNRTPASTSMDTLRSALKRGRKK